MGSTPEFQHHHESTLSAQYRSYGDQNVSLHQVLGEMYVYENNVADFCLTLESII